MVFRNLLHKWQRSDEKGAEGQEHRHKVIAVEQLLPKCLRLTNGGRIEKWQRWGSRRVVV